MNRKDVYLVEELAERSKKLLGVVRSASTIRKDCAAGNVLKAELFGRAWVIPKSSVSAYKKYIESQNVGRPTAPKEYAWFFPDGKLEFVEKLVKKHGGEIRLVPKRKSP
jgi:hypothetical protein